MKIYTSIAQLIGHTPMLELTAIAREEGLSARLLAKLERCNPGGSVKDRTAKAMLDDAQSRGLLTERTVIIEPTSGNTGIGLCLLAAARGLRCILVMPENMSVERRKLIRAYGGEVVLTPAEAGMPGAVETAKALAEEYPDSFLPMQFSNPANPAAHIAGTGPEIWEDTGGMVDFFVAGVGTGGTITGVGRFLKSKNPEVRVAAVEPAGAPVLSAGRTGTHGIPGIGAGFVPEILDRDVIDCVIPVADGDALAAARSLARREGLLAGISSGAALWAAMRLARENPGAVIVLLLPDTGERYLSAGL